MGKDYRLPNGGVYRSITGSQGGIEKIMNSTGMQRHMAGVAEAAAGRARTYADDPSAVRSSTEKHRDRWRAVVTNTSRTAMAQEYGVPTAGRKRPVLARKPLGHALDWVESQDPGRRMGRRASRARLGT